MDGTSQLTAATVTVQQLDNDEAGFLVFGAPGDAPLTGDDGLPVGLQHRVDSRTMSSADNVYLLTGDADGMGNPASMAEGGSAFLAVALTSQPSGNVRVRIGVHDTGAVPANAISNLTREVLDFSPTDWSVPKAARVLTAADGVASPARRPVHVSVEIDAAGTMDSMYAGLAGASIGGKNATLVLPLREADRVGVSVQPQSAVVAVIQTAAGSTSYIYRDVELTLRLESRPTASVQVDCVVTGDSSGYLTLTGPSQRVIHPSDWKDSVVFGAIRSQPSGPLPAGHVETLFLKGTVQLEFQSADPSYNSATQRAIGASATDNPLAAADGITRVQVLEVIEPAERPIETIFVQPPNLHSASILEVAEAILLQFDRDTSMGGRQVLE